MKKSFLFIIGFLLAFTLQARSEYSGFQSPEEEKIKNEFSDLSALEQFLESHPETDLEQMKADPALYQQFGLEKLNLHKPLSPNFEFDDMDWGSFAWGLCCWPVGVFTVLLNDDKDQDDKISYLIGLGIFIMFGGGFWFCGYPRYF